MHRATGHAHGEMPCLGTAGKARRIVLPMHNHAGSGSCWDVKLTAGSVWDLRSCQHLLISTDRVDPHPQCLGSPRQAGSVMFGAGTYPPQDNITRAGAIPPLIGLLDHTALRELAAAVLAKLAHEHEDNQSASWLKAMGSVLDASTRVDIVTCCDSIVGVSMFDLIWGHAPAWNSQVDGDLRGLGFNSQFIRPSRERSAMGPQKGCF